MDDGHVDHSRQNFSHLVSGFRAASGWSRDMPDSVVSAPAYGLMAATFIDSALWQEFLFFGCY